MPLKILFMGTPEFAVPILKSLHNSKHNLAYVYSQPPKKKSRGQKITPSPIQEISEKLKISFRCPVSLIGKDELNFIKNLKPDIVIVVAYGKIIPKEILDLPNIKFINIHASILPRWRGAAPVQRAIMNLDKETGISIMKMTENLDAGPVMKITKINITKTCNYESLSKKLSELSASLILECLTTLEKKEEKFISQDHSKATYAKKIDKSESKIDWNDKAKYLVAKINALNPNPGTWFELNGIRIKILKAQEVYISGKPGEIIDNKLTIGCLENSLQILKLKKEGKNEMSSLEFLKGNKLKVGTILNGV